MNTCTNSSIPQNRYKVSFIDPAELKFAGFNPELRTSGGDSNKPLSLLKERIRQFGILHPLLVTSANEIIDGHRRCQAALELRMSEVPCLVVKLSLQDTYAAVAESQRKHGGAEWLQAVSQGYSADEVPSNHRNRIKKLKDTMGEDGVSWLAARGVSSGIVVNANKVAKFLGWESGRDYTRIVRWMVLTGSQHPAREGIQNGYISPATIITAINQNKSIEKKVETTYEIVEESDADDED